MKTTDRIYEWIAQQNRLVTIKELHDSLDIKQSALAGFLVGMCKSGRLVREKIERATTSTGPKMQWAYKVVAQTQQSEA